MYRPEDPLILLPDCSAVEASGFVTQWCPTSLRLKIISCFSVLLTTALRRQSPLHRESFAFDKTLCLAHPYLLQTKALANYAFTDASVISYVSRCKSFKNFLQCLAETVSLYPNLHVCHMPGKANMLADTLTRSLDEITLDRNDTNLSKKWASIVPPTLKMKPGKVVSHEKLVEMIQSTPCRIC